MVRKIKRVWTVEFKDGRVYEQEEYMEAKDGLMYTVGYGLGWRLRGSEDVILDGNGMFEEMKKADFEYKLKHHDMEVIE